MVLLTGFFRDSGGNPIASGILRIRLDAPLFDVSATPDALYLQQPAEFEIIDGAIPAINLTESATQQVTYEFTLLVNSEQVEFYFPNGDPYDGPTHQHTDSKWYTGFSHRDESQELDRFARVTPRQIDQFHAIVPNQLTVEYSALVPTRVSTDKLPTTVRQLAELLINTPQYRQALRGGPQAVGTFDPNTFYAEDDWVEYDGSSYVYINTITTKGNYPPNTTYWQLMASKGATGTGTTGNNTAYNATTWDGQTDAPSRNAVRDIIEQLARSSDLANYAPLDSAALTGNPTRTSAPAFGDRSNQIPTTQWVGNEFAPIDSPVFLNNPAVPLQATSDRSNKAASTQWVENYFNSLNLLNTPIFVAHKTATQNFTTGTGQTLIFTTKIVDTDNAFNTSTATFTVPNNKAGYYEFSVAVYLDRTGGASFDAQADLMVDSTAYRFAQIMGYTGASYILTGAPITLYLNAGATAALRINVAGTVACTNYPGFVLTRFSGKRLRA